MKDYQFTAHITKDNETGLFCGMIPGLPGAHSQGQTLDELNANLKEVIELCLEEIDLDDLGASEFVGLQQISIAK